MEKCSDLKIAVVSDIHLGHRRNPTNEIISNLMKAFPDNSETGELDIIFIAGDIFDDLLMLSNEDVWEIKIWVASLLRLCKKHDILLRVLEGTPSHDRGQSEMFPNTNVVANIGADLKYVKEISIEYIQRCDISILYVPDEANITTEKTLSQIQELLTAKGLTQVDYAIMHGQFNYQLPEFIKAQKHDAEEYLKIVKELILIGHVHEYSRYDRIIAQGSFDRLSHGQEGPKGHVRVIKRKNGDRDITFVENVTAKKFITVKCDGFNLEDTIDEIDDQVVGLPDESFVRVSANYDNPIFTNMEMLIRRYPLFTWSKLVKEANSNDAVIVEDETLYSAITLTQDNIGDLLMERMAHTGVSGNVLETARNILKEIL